MTTNANRPRGFLPLGIFFFFAASMATLAAVTLGFPGTFLDRAWELNKTAHAQLAPLGRIMGLHLPLWPRSCCERYGAGFPDCRVAMIRVPSGV